MIAGVLGSAGASWPSPRTRSSSRPATTFQFDLTGWGWVHLALAPWPSSSVWPVPGVPVGPDRRRRHRGLIIIANFLSLPYYPVWSIVMIAFSAFIIWALCVVKRTTRRTRFAEGRVLAQTAAQVGQHATVQQGLLPHQPRLLRPGGPRRIAGPRSAVRNRAASASRALVAANSASVQPAASSEPGSVPRTPSSRRSPPRTRTTAAEQAAKEG
ncbi:DUF7144 family membrane protein [Streptomyces scabiei]|uniref:DUF7144 family membrane protein n=1 Tax=Streptomyces scabiei TaxID=1930 RepID=UPI003D1610C8